MAPQSTSNETAEDLEFLITVMMTADEFNPNFWNVASHSGMPLAQLAMEKFKAIVEKSGKHQCHVHSFNRQSVMITDAAGVRSFVPVEFGYRHEIDSKAAAKDASQKE